MNSLKTKIIKSYLGLYMIICVMIVFGLMVACFWATPRLLYTKDAEAIQSSIVPTLKGGYSYQEHNPQIEVVENAYDVQIAILSDRGRLIRDSEEIYGTKFLQNQNLLQRFFPSFSLINEGVYTQKIQYNTTDSLVIFFPIQRYGTVLMISAVALFFVLAAGAGLIVLLGNSVNRRIFRQIESLDGTIRMINAENLALRLDEKTIDDELHTLVNTINQMIDGLQSSYLRQKRFVSDVSHELRTPISVIAGYANMLQRWGKNDKEVMEEALDAIESETKNMTDLVEKLLFLARHDNKTLQYEFQKLPVSDLLREIYQETVLLDEDHQIEKDIQDNLYVWADENRIKEVVRILLDNALKYTPKGKRISIGAEKNNRSIFISVTDEGMGIGEEDIEHIFDRFYRTDKARNHTKGDHGLGLSIARLIIADHGGKIEISSKLGEGSRFTIILPAKL